MSYETTLIYTEKIVRRAIVAYWRRTIAFRYLLLPLALIGWLAFTISQGESSVLTRGAAGATLVGVTLWAFLYLIHYRKSMAKFREMRDPRIKFRASDESFHFSSEMGSSTLPWSVIKELWQFPDFWLFVYARGQFNTLPTDCLASEMRDFVAERVRSAGGKIV